MTDLNNINMQKTVALAQQQKTIAAAEKKAQALQTEKAAANGIDMKAVDEAAQEFEAMYLTEMLRPMFEEVMKPDPVFGGGKGEEIFSKMMVDEYGKQIAASGGVGIAKHVKAELIRIQEAAHGQQ